MHPLYAQPECSPETKIYVFGFVKRRGEVLADDQLALWVIWLLFSLMLTLWLGIHSVLSSSDSVHDYKEESLPPQATKSLFRRLLIQRFPKDGRNARRIHYWTVNLFVTLVWALYVASSERQMTRNKIFEGENDVASFGQVSFRLPISESRFDLIDARIVGCRISIDTCSSSESNRGFVRQVTQE